MQSARSGTRLSLVAPRPKPRTLLEANTLLAAGALMTEAERVAGEKLPLMRQARIMLKAMPKANRVGQFVAMWTIVKYHEGATSAERVADYWGEPRRTVYRWLEEFREVWGQVGYDTPDELADALIADYRGRKEPLTGRDIAKLLSAGVSVPRTALPPNVAT